MTGTVTGVEACCKDFNVLLIQRDGKRLFIPVSKSMNLHDLRQMIGANIQFTVVSEDKNAGIMLARLKEG